MTLQTIDMKYSSIILFILLSVFLGCSGKDKVKPSADSLLTTEAFAVIDAIEKAYETKNKYDLNKHVESRLAEGIANELVFETADLSLAPKIVKITDSTVSVTINWRGSWRFANDRKFENRGAADLVFHRKTMKLTHIDGNNPFLFPSEMRRD